MSTQSAQSKIKDVLIHGGLGWYPKKKRKRNNIMLYVVHPPNKNIGNTQSFIRFLIKDMKLLKAHNFYMVFKWKYKKD